jgi:hypothetical protein
MNLALARERMVSEPSIVKAMQLRLAARSEVMTMRTMSYVAAVALGVATFAGPASAQLKGIGGHVGGAGAPHIGGAGIAAHSSIGTGLGASSSFGAGKVGAAPLMTGRSVAAPNAGLAAATAGSPKAGFAARPGFTTNPTVRGAWAGGHHRRVWPYAAAAAGAGLAYGVGTYGYDYGYPYDTGYYDPGYDVAPVAPVAGGLVDEGGSCATPVLVCRLYEPAEIGLGCTCTANGGPVRGVVQP